MDNALNKIVKKPARSVRAYDLLSPARQRTVDGIIDALGPAVDRMSPAARKGLDAATKALALRLRQRNCDI